MLSKYVLIDTSAWLFALRKDYLPEIKDRVDLLLKEDLVLTTGIIRLELLAGTRTDSEYERLKNRLSSLEKIVTDESLWEMLGSLFQQIGLGELGTPGKVNEKLDMGTSCSDWQIIYALLELYRASEDQLLLRQACRIGDNLLEWQASHGLFARPGRQYARTGDEVPLAILHLVAAIQNKLDLIPDPMLDASFFHAIFHGELEPYQQKRDDNRTYDHYVYYGPH